MSDSTFLALPFLEAAQAQKHVTVNEALRRLDAAVQLAVESCILAEPPAAPDEGARYIIAAGGSGDWAGHDGEVAVWSDGAWDFFTPREGWRAWDKGGAGFVYWTGTDWATEPGDGLAASAHGAATVFHVLEADHEITAGTMNDTVLAIPERAIVLGVTGIVLGDITGPTSWTLGVAADAGRYGTGIGTDAGSTVIGPSGPVTYWSETALRLAATGDDFSGGAVRFAVHYLTLTGPTVES
jgi:hypothetical protein